MDPLNTFLTIFNELDHTSLNRLDTIYHPDICFTDPAHTLKGLPALKDYFAALYENVRSIRFFFDARMMTGNQAFVTWTMALSHPRLAGGRTVSVDGCSHLTFASDGRVTVHRDYFDLGAMVYEHLPVMGSLIRTVKKRLGS